MERWTKEEEKYLIDTYMTTMYCDIAKVLNKTEGAIRAKCFDLNLVKNSAWTSDEIEYLKENYNTKSIKEIAKYLNRTENSVHLKASRNGLKKSPYNCNYDFFKIIDSEEKAYWLGFIAADGWITVNEKSNAGTVGIELQYRDINHLKKFNKSICGNYKIDTLDKTCEVSPCPDRVHKMCRIRIFSIDMVNDLYKFGITKDKTYNFHMPNVPENLIKHFVRGYFDGDGCVRTRDRKLASGQIVKYPLCDFSSVDINFLEELRQYIYDKLGICSYIYTEESGCRRLCIHKNEHTMAFLNYLYNDAKIYLDRKYEKYLSIMSNATHESLAN